MRSGTLRRNLGNFLEGVVVTLMVALAVVVVVAVIFRKSGAALVWYDEIASILLAWLTYFGASLAALKRAHIGFPKLVETLAPALRTKVIIVREVIVVGFFVLTAWSGWLVLQALDGTYLVSLPWLPARVTQSIIPIGAVLFVLAELLSLTEDSGRPEPEERSP